MILSLRKMGENFEDDIKSDESKLVDFILKKEIDVDKLSNDVGKVIESVEEVIEIVVEVKDNVEKVLENVENS